MEKSTEFKPKVSVVLPNYNYAHYLDARIESILNQTFQDFELIILDDASKDGSREVIEKYRNHPKVSLIEYNEKNSGIPCSQWAKGTNLARGEYVWIAEADDLCDSRFLQTAVEELDRDGQACLFFSMAHIMDSDGELTSPGYFRYFEPDYRLRRGETAYRFTGVFFIKYYLSWYNSIYNASGTVFRKSAVSQAEWDEACTYLTCGDWYFWSAIIGKGGNVIVAKDRMNYFRIHAKSATKFLPKHYSALSEEMRIKLMNLEGADARRRKVIIGNTFREWFLARKGSPADMFAVMRVFLSYFDKKYLRECICAGKLNRSVFVKALGMNLSVSKEHRRREIL